jgi:hypothetical protein
MSHSINWKLLGAQYFSDGAFSEEIRKLVHVDKVIHCVLYESINSESLVFYVWLVQFQ